MWPPSMAHKVSLPPFNQTFGIQCKTLGNWEAGRFEACVCMQGFRAKSDLWLSSLAEVFLPCLMETYRPLAAIRTTCGWLSSRSNSSSLPGLEHRPDLRVPVGPMGDKYFPSQSLNASFPHFSSSVYAVALPFSIKSFPSLLRKRLSQVLMQYFPSR